MSKEKLANQDPETGIFYGVIHFGLIESDAWHHFWNNTVDLNRVRIKQELDRHLRAEFTKAISSVFQDFERPTGGNPVLEEIDGEFMDDIVDTVMVAAEDAVHAHYDPELVDAYRRYEKDGYIIEMKGDDLFVIKSPYYTFAPACSPCVPNAGHLGDLISKVRETGDSEYPGPVKCYALDASWFDVLPYAYHSVHPGGSRPSCPHCGGTGRLAEVVKPV